VTWTNARIRQPSRELFVFDAVGDPDEWILPVGIERVVRFSSETVRVAASKRGVPLEVDQAAVALEERGAGS